MKGAEIRRLRYIEQHLKALGHEEDAQLVNAAIETLKGYKTALEAITVALESNNVRVALEMAREALEVNK